MKKRPPQWGNFLYHADEDIKAFCVLYCSGLMVRSYFFAVQSIEKYLKAFLWSLNPDLTPGQLKDYNHKFDKLLRDIDKIIPNYSDHNFFSQIKKFKEFTFSTRYPYTVNKFHNGFSGQDRKDLVNLIYKLRCDINIELDKYPLGVLLNKDFEEDISDRDKFGNNTIRDCIEAVFGDI